MFYQLSHLFSEHFSTLNIFHYITFRSMAGLLTALGVSLLLSPWFIRNLQKKQMKQIVRDDGPKSHFSKAGTPTMGGGLIIFAVTLSALLWVDWSNLYFWFTLTIFTTFGLLGFWDDYLKISKKNPKGASGKTKLFWQILIALVVCSIHYFLDNQSSRINIPFFKNTFIDLGPFYVPFCVFVIVGTSNSVNLTDGLDGLAIGPVMIAALCYAILSYVSGNSVIAEYLNFPFVKNAGELAIFSTCLVGAGLGFLWYNSYPAQVFMGDIGSLPLGGALGAIAVFSKHEILLAIIGGIFVLEAVSVMTQVASFKMTGKRVFRMAPIHHHFELKGWPEPKVIVRFWIISCVLALIGLMSLKIR